MNKRIYLREFLPDCDGVPTVVCVRLGRGRYDEIHLTKFMVIEIIFRKELLLSEDFPNGRVAGFHDSDVVRILAAVKKIQGGKLK